MDKGMYATVDHRKLMELKNCGAIVPDRIEEIATALFEELRFGIKTLRKNNDEYRGWFSRLFLGSLSIDQEVDIMFSTRAELIEHLSAIEVPSKLCPITEELKEQIIFLDRAALYTAEAAKILDMFKRHHEVIVDSDHSVVVDWVLQNATRIRTLIS
ncbi:hypothetical protein A71_36 [Escherichia phage A7_1]|nr:hypothetical protein [Escherichia phage UPEC06]UZZ64114.1 hypothetical protein A71_36 [Escherichia phage A7_1]